MKFLIMSGIICSILLSCSMIQDDYTHWYYLSDDSKVPENIKTFKDIHKWVYNEEIGIKYKNNSKNNIMLPQEVLDRGYGNCIEQSLLILAIVKKRCNYKGQLDCGKLNNGGYLTHAEARCYGKTIMYNNDKYVSQKIIDFDNIANEVRINKLF